MTILHALCRHYDRIAEQEDTPRPGFSSEKISYAIILSPEGTVLDVVSVQDTTGPTPKPRKMAVPAARKRASNIAPNLLWDKTAYVLGVTADNDRKKERLAQEHAAFRALHAEALKDTGDAGLAALAKFLDRWTSDQFEAPPFREEMRDTNVVFRLSAERRYLHDRPAANDLVERLSRDAADTEEEGLCLITARRGPVARLHPPVKGVRGAQSSGASIMSFNLDAFTSHGKIQGLNAPISTDASFKAHTALNRLLDKDSRQKITIGDTTVAFWADPPDGEEQSARPAENLFSAALQPSKEGTTAEIRDALASLAAGKPLRNGRAKIAPSLPFHILGLAPNASRLSVRLYHQNTLGALAQRVTEHWQDLAIEPSPWKHPPEAWQILLETALRLPDGKSKPETIPPLLAGALTRAILTGGRYPQTLLTTMIMRIRADRILNGRRASILKACLTRSQRLGSQQEDIPVSLNTEETNTAYRLGRLFAALEGAQRAALGSVNATIRDRYFSSASATPALVFPALIRNAQNHLKAIRTKQGEGLAIHYDKTIRQIVDGLCETSLPRTLSTADQGRFAIGYYHQSSSLHRTKSTDKGEDDSDT